MRAIKFRAKRLDNGEWVYGSLISYKSGEAAIAQFSRYGHEVSEMKGRRVLVNIATIGQFTGLHDANGVEIYEGDLLLSHENSEVFEVVYDAPRFCFKDNDFGFRFLNRPENFGVVGNIHDDKGRLENN